MPRCNMQRQRVSERGGPQADEILGRKCCGSRVQALGQIRRQGICINGHAQHRVKSMRVRISQCARQPAQRPQPRFGIVLNLLPICPCPPANHHRVHLRQNRGMTMLDQSAAILHICGLVRTKSPRLPACHDCAQNRHWRRIRPGCRAEAPLASPARARRAIGAGILPAPDRRRYCAFPADHCDDRIALPPRLRRSHCLST